MPKKFDDSPQAVERRRRVIKRLENQLLTGYKTVNVGVATGTEPLTDADKARINKELEILKTRL